MGDICQGISRKIDTKTGRHLSRNIKENSYAPTGVVGWFESKRCSHVQGRWVGQNCDDFGRMYFLNDPLSDKVPYVVIYKRVIYNGCKHPFPSK